MEILQTEDNCMKMHARRLGFISCLVRLQHSSGQAGAASNGGRRYGTRVEFQGNLRQNAGVVAGAFRCTRRESRLGADRVGAVL